MPKATLTTYERTTLQRAYHHLAALPPVKAVRIPAPVEKGRLAIVTKNDRLVYSFRVKRTVFPKTLGYVVAQIRKQSADAGARRLLVTDYLTDEALEILRSEPTVDYVDEAGNMLLRWPTFYVDIRGHRRPHRPERARSLAPAGGMRVIFALLAQRSLHNVLYRDLERLSGVTLGTISQTVQELQSRGLLDRRLKQLVIAKPQELLELWVNGYAQSLRPRLVIGRYRSAAPLEDVVKQLRETQDDREWALTGGFAAETMTRYYRGETLGVFIGNWKPQRATEWRWLPDPEGPITVFRPFSDWLLQERSILPGAPVIHPLLVYAELIFDGRERARAAAERVREKYLAYLNDASSS